MTNEEEQRRAVIKEFYQLYRPLQKRYNLRLHSHFSIYGGDFIKIWQYKGEERVKLFCKAEEDSEIECYKRVIEELKSHNRYAEDIENEKRAG